MLRPAMKEPAAITTMTPMTSTTDPTPNGLPVQAASTAPAAAHPDHGHIRSFVHRRSHITPGQKEALDRLMPQWSLPYRPLSLDFAATFGRTAPTILEIGFGMGETTEKIATARPDENFLGVEVFNAGVGGLLKRIEQSGLTNIRIIQHDAVDVLRNMIPPDSLAGVHIYFPDPWPKARHHKRRLIQPLFAALLASRIQPGGYLHCATDWENYAEQMLAVLSAEPQLRNTCDGYAPRPDYRPQTKFEARGLKLGHLVRDLIFTRVPPAAS
jgi:tRNA (guanine-N7-)-methyltransferase